MGVLALFRRKPHLRAGFALYTAAVTAARAPWLFGRLGVADTLDGRFDLVGLHVALLIRRLQQDPAPQGNPLAQAVFDAMFADMDMSLREMGVSDMSVARRMRQLWEALHGRAQAYDAALADADPTALAGALSRNIWRTTPGPEGPTAAALALAGHTRAIAATLAEQPFARLLAGEVRFPAPPPETDSVPAPADHAAPAAAGHAAPAPAIPEAPGHDR
jgi:cytochrome b pre-mRNA-processing protein 3